MKFGWIVRESSYSKKHQKARVETIKEFLARGGKIKKYPPGYAENYSAGKI